MDAGAKREPPHWVRAAVAHVAAGLVITLLVLGVVVVAMMYVQTPSHMYLPRHIPLDDTIRLGPKATMEVQRLPAGLTASMAAAPRTSRVTPHMRDAGIVVAAGGRHLVAAAALTSVLRDVHRCGLPIQVWHAGAAELRVSEPVELRALDALRRTPGVTFHDLHAVPAFQRCGAAGSHAGALALTATRLRHVVLLAADALPLADPALLLRTDTYRAVGAVVFPDFQGAAPRSLGTTHPFLPGIRTKLGITWPESNAVVTHHVGDAYTVRVERGEWPTWAADGSLTLFDRARHWRALHAVLWLATRHTHMAWFMRTAKDSVWLGMELARDAMYTRAARYAGGLVVAGCEGRGPDMHVQFLEGRPVHVSHATTLPHLPGVRHAGSAAAIAAALATAVTGVVNTAGKPAHAAHTLDLVPSLVRAMRQPTINSLPCAMAPRPGASTSSATNDMRVVAAAYVWALHHLHEGHEAKCVSAETKRAWSLWYRLRSLLLRRLPPPTCV